MPLPNRKKDRWRTVLVARRLPQIDNQGCAPDLRQCLLSAGMVKVRVALSMSLSPSLSLSHSHTPQGCSHSLSLSLYLSLSISLTHARARAHTHTHTHTHTTRVLSLSPSLSLLLARSLDPSPMSGTRPCLVRRRLQLVVLSFVEAHWVPTDLFTIQQLLLCLGSLTSLPE